MELEAEGVARETGFPLASVRQAVKELWEEGELEVRPIGDSKFILCRQGGKAVWLRPIK